MHLLIHGKKVECMVININQIGSALMKILDVGCKLYNKEDTSLISVGLSHDYCGQIARVYLNENSTTVNGVCDEEGLIKIRIKNVGHCIINEFYIGMKKSKLEYIKGTENLHVNEWFNILLFFDDGLFDKNNEIEFMIAYTEGKNYNRHVNKYVIIKEKDDYVVVGSRSLYRKNVKNNM